MDQEVTTPHESIRLIGEMIEKAKVNIASGAKYFLLWGWAAFAACIGQFILQATGYEHAYVVWMLMPLCAIISMVMSRSDDRKSRVRTYVEDGMGYLWLGMGITFTVLVIIFIRTGWMYSMPVFILLYATGTFISGKFLRFTPMIVGSVISYIIAATSVWMPFEYHSLAGAVALLSCYIIPGHLLKTQNL